MLQLVDDIDSIVLQLDGHHHTLVNIYVRDYLDEHLLANDWVETRLRPTTAHASHLMGTQEVAAETAPSKPPIDGLDSDTLIRDWAKNGLLAYLLHVSRVI
ncbi:hypothetical protein TNCV_4576551 [Trichonephila clavipes]|nr:hypothetical protein TNCV_4576551 [Trichonephila clavipes]